jgi:cobalt/nickel transport system permease protein
MGIDQYAYLSPLRTAHPGEKILLAILTMVAVLAMDSLLISGLVFIFMSVVILVAGRVPWRIYFNLLLVPLLFLLVGCAGVALVVLSQPVGLVAAFPVGAYWLGVSHASLQAALGVFWRCLACIACMYFLALTTPMTQIIQVLRKTRLPDALIEVMGLIYGAIFGLMAAAASG